MTAPTRFLVTGGTGFIGAALVRRLINDGHAVRVVDNDLRGNRSRLADCAGRFELCVADVRDREAMTLAARDIECIIHLAALNGTENFYRRPELVLDVGIGGMQAMLAAAKANDVRQFVFASSSEVYQTPARVPTAEDVPMCIPDPWNPRYSYGGSKLISEIMLANYHRDFFERAIIFRPHNVYGPDMGWEHVIPQLVMRAKEQTERYPDGPVPFEIQGDGSQTRSFIYIDDFIDGLILTISGGKHRHVYHIGTMDEVTIRQLVDILFAWFGRTPNVQATPAPAGGTPRRCPEIGRLRGLGFVPRWSLADGIAVVARWYCDHAEEQPSR